MDRIVHESVLTNTSDEKVNALMYQAMLDETIRLRSCRKEAERNQIRSSLWKYIDYIMEEIRKMTV